MRYFTDIYDLLKDMEKNPKRNTIYILDERASRYCSYEDFRKRVLKIKYAVSLLRYNRNMPSLVQNKEVRK